MDTWEDDTGWILGDDSDECPSIDQLVVCLATDRNVSVSAECMHSMHVSSRNPILVTGQGDSSSIRSTGSHVLGSSNSTRDPRETATSAPPDNAGRDERANIC